MNIHLIPSYRPWLAALLAAAFTLARAGTAHAADNTVTYAGSPTGSKVTIAGTSTAHDWTMDSTLVAGKLELPEGFKLDPSLKPGKISATAQISLTVRSFKSGHDGMDAVMQQAMKSDKFPKIEYQLSELTLKEAAKAAGGAFQFDSKGDLIVAGVTNKVSMPISILQVSPVRLKISGSLVLKMTDYGVKPPNPNILGVGLKTGDEVKITFDWVAVQRSGKP